MQSPVDLERYYLRCQEAYRAAHRAYAEAGDALEALTIAAKGDRSALTSAAIIAAREKYQDTYMALYQETIAMGNASDAIRMAAQDRAGRSCKHCTEFFARFACAGGVQECDCPKCQGYCTCGA